LCDSIITNQKTDITGIAHAHIKDRRAHRVVPVSAKGMLSDYVPFYFCSRSVMLYVIHNGQVKGYQGGQKPILHLVSSAEKVAQAKLPFAFTDGHAEVQISHYYDTLADTNQLDWKIIHSWKWSNQPPDYDQKRRKQAEFLVHHFFPWGLVEEIGVFDDEIAQQVNELLLNQTHRPIVRIQRKWYYQGGG